MDSQHRHELHQNDLRKLTNRTLPFFKRYGTQLLVAIGLLTVAFIGGSWWYATGKTSSAESWTQLDATLMKENPSADDYARLADKFSKSEAAQWAQLMEADDYLKSGLQYLFTDREAALADLKKSQAVFERLASGGSSVVSDIRERALFGLARCLESTSGSETQGAADAYRRLVKEFPNSMYVTLANERIAILEKPGTKEFYAWFQQQNPKPRNPLEFPFRKPADGEEAESDDMPAGEQSSGGAEESSAAPVTDAPADAKPEGEKPAAETATEQPPEKPADAKTP